MDDLKAFLTEHSRVSVIVLAILLIFVGGSAVRCTSLQIERAEQAAPQEQGEQAQTDGARVDEDGGAGTQDASAGADEQATSEAEDDAVALLSEEMRMRQGEYDAAAIELVGTLSANTWAVANEAATLTFTDKTYTETTPSGSETHAYVVLATAKQNDTRGLLETTTAAIETDNGTYIMELMRATDEAGTEVTMGLACDAFKHSGYARADAAGGLVVSGLNSEINLMLGEQADQLKTELTDYCSKHYPSAGTATWDGRAEVDYEEGTIKLVFTLDNQAKTHVYVTYSINNHTFDIGKAA